MGAKDSHGEPAFRTHLQEHGGGMALWGFGVCAMVTNIITTEKTSMTAKAAPIRLKAGRFGVASLKSGKLSRHWTSFIAAPS
jgi:hypothetical protein